MVYLTFDLVNVAKLRKQFGDKVVNRALGITTNKLTARAKTAVDRAVRARYNISKAEFTRRADVKKMRRYNDGFIASLRYRGGRMGLINFDVQQTRRIQLGSMKRDSKGRFTGGRHAGRVYSSRTSLKVKRDKHGKKEVGGKTALLSDKRKHAYGISVVVRKGHREVIGPEDSILPFIATGRNHLPHIFRRKTKDRDSQERLNSLSIPQMVNAVNGDEVVSDIIQAHGAIEFDRAMRYLTEVSDARRY